MSPFVHIVALYARLRNRRKGDVVDTETAEPVEETEEKQAENEAGTEEEKVSTETEKSGQDFPGK